MLMVEDRIAALESRADTLESRVRELEAERTDWAPPRPPGQREPLAAAPHPGAGTPHAAAPRPSGAAVPAARAARPARDIEDYLGGNVLAWLGGFAVLAGLAFLLTMAISRGWLGEGARTLLAGGLSLGLLGAGVWLREHRDRTEAAVVAAAVGIAGMFGTLVVAGPVYDLVPRPVALFGAFATGAVAVTLAIRWRTQVYGWLGLLGALTAPLALGALDGGGIVFLAIAFAATIAVLVWQRWAVLAATAFVATTLQWLGWLVLEMPGDGVTILTLATFGVLTAALALGLEATRRGLHPVAIGPRARLVPHPFTVVLALSAALLAAAGWELLDGEPWLVALALAYIVLGVAAAHVRRISREVALGTLATGLVLANLAFASIASGLPLVLGWALSALPFAALLGARTGAPSAATRVFDRILGRPEGEQAERADRILAIAGLVGQMLLAAGQTLLFDARPEALAGPAAPPEALIAAGAFAVLSWAAARLVRHPWRTGLDAVALAAVAHLTGLVLEGAALTAMFAAEALALAELARRRQDRHAAWAAAAFAVLGVAHAVVTLAAPEALFSGLDAPLAAAAALGAAAIALALVARLPEAPRLMGTAAALTLLYLASVEVATLGGPEETGQTLLSVLWAVVGVAALIRGLRVDDRPLRRAALALIALTATKVFLYDLAALDSMYRVGSLIGFGILLLFGAFAYQRVRPQV
jgi:uncharacterized membrane protein